MNATSVINATTIHIVADNPYELNKAMLLGQGLMMGMLFFAILVFTLILFIMIFANLRRKEHIWMYVPVFALFIVILAVWVFAYLYFATSTWGVLAK